MCVYIILYIYMLNYMYVYRRASVGRGLRRKSPRQVLIIYGPEAIVARAHIGPGTIWALAPLAPRHIGPWARWSSGPIWVLAHLGFERALVQFRP